jgi:hypothetical protein
VKCAKEIEIIQKSVKKKRKRKEKIRKRPGEAISAQAE